MRIEINDLGIGELLSTLKLRLPFGMVADQRSKFGRGVDNFN